MSIDVEAVSISSRFNNHQLSMFNCFVAACSFELTPNPNDTIKFEHRHPSIFNSRSGAHITDDIITATIFSYSDGKLNDL